MTGIQPPKNIPRDSGGNERAEEFFNTNPNEGGDGENQEGEEEEDDEEEDVQQLLRRSSNAAPNSAGRRKSQPGGTSNNDKGAGGARKDRPDKYAEMGERGRLVLISLFSFSANSNSFLRDL